MMMRSNMLASSLDIRRRSKEQRQHSGEEQDLADPRHLRLRSEREYSAAPQS
jgi:hypothetical protein